MSGIFLAGASVALLAVATYELSRDTAGVPAPLSPASMSAVGASLAASPASAALPNVETMVERLVARLEQQPDDMEGWRMLGWSYLNTDRAQDAAAAYRRATVLAPENAELQASYGEALVRAEGGTVSPTALAAFEEALRLDVSEPRARFFIGLVKEQKGERRAALDDWQALIAAAPADAAWLPGLRQRASAQALELGSGPAATVPVVAEVTTGETGAPAGQQVMIEGMVGGLESRLTQNPLDADGWIVLARSKKVMGDEAAARAALARAREVFFDSPEMLDRLAVAARELALEAAD